MTDLEKAYYIIDRIINDENFDLIDYYEIESRKPAEFVKSIKTKLSPAETRIIGSFAGSNEETSEWKERHYVIFYNTRYVMSDRLITKEDKDKIIGDLLNLGLSINDRTVRVMMKRYVRLSLENEEAQKVLVK